MELSKVALDGGGSILVEAASGLDGPVKAGRVGDAIHALPVKLSAALEPVAEAARTVLEQLRKAGPATIGVEFGIDLATQAGVVITRAETMCHLKVTLTWSGEHESKSHGEHAGE